MFRKRVDLMAFELLVYAVTGFSVALSLYFLHAALRGWYLDFDHYTLRDHGIFISALWFAAVGPVVSAKIAHVSAVDEDYPQPVKAVVAAIVMLFWASMLGIFVQECARMYIHSFPV